MRKLKFLLVSVFGALSVTIGEAFLRRVIAASLCGTLALNSSWCVPSLDRGRDVNTNFGSHGEVIDSEVRSLEKSSISRNTTTNPLIFSTNQSAGDINNKAASGSSTRLHTIAQTDNDAKTATLNGDLSKYDTIEKRNGYYQQIHDALQVCPGTKGIQFFAAAENVTRFAGVGIVESWWSDHSEATKQVYKDINATLFKENAKIAKSLLEKCKPVQPEHPEKPCFGVHSASSGFDFDIAMTEFEQNIVQRQFMERYQDDPAYKAVFEEINNDLNFKGVKRTIAENSLAWNLSKAGNWAKEALGVTQLEYRSTLLHE